MCIFRGSNTSTIHVGVLNTQQTLKFIEHSSFGKERVLQPQTNISLLCPWKFTTSLSDKHALRTLTTHSFGIGLLIFFAYAWTFLEVKAARICRLKLCINLSHLTRVVHGPAHPILSIHCPSNIWWKAHIVKLHITQCFQPAVISSCWRLSALFHTHSKVGLTL